MLDSAMANKGACGLCLLCHLQRKQPPTLLTPVAEFCLCTPQLPLQPHEGRLLLIQLLNKHYIQQQNTEDAADHIK